MSGCVVAPDQHLVAAGADVQADRDLVAHRAAGQEHRGLVAEQLGHALLERAHRRVLAALLVADLGRGDRRAHRRRRARLRVGVEVDGYALGHRRGTIDPAARILGARWPPRPHPRDADPPGRAAQDAARRPGRLPLPRRQGQGHLRRQGEVDPQARRQPLLQPGHARRRTRWSTRSTRRVRPRRLRGRGAADRAELHQAVQAALQHPPARRQVLSVHRDLAGRGLPARLLHARAPPPRPRLLRPVLERQARARHARPAAARSSCSAPATGAEPGRRSGSPCLDYYIKRCGAPCVGYVDQGGVPRGDRRRHRLPLRPLPRDRARPRGADEGRGGRAGVRAGGARAQPPARRAGRLLERQRVANESVGTLDAVAIAVDGTDANAQVFQVRDGVLSDRQSFYLDNETERGDRRGRRGVPPAVLRRRDGDPAAGHRPARASRSPRRSREALGERRGARGRGARRRARRQAPDPRAGRAQRAARARPGAPEGRAPPPAARRGARRPAGGARARRAAAADRVLRHLEPRWARTRSPRWSSSRAARRRSPTTGASRSAGCTEGVPDDFAAMEEVLVAPPGAVGAPAGPQPARPQAQRVLRDAAERRRHRRRPGPAVGRRCARCRASATAASRSSRWPSASRRSSSPAAATPIVLAARHARAAAAAARARRGAPLRDHPPPQRAATRR